MNPKKKILLKVTGSIAAFKAAALASKLVQNGFEVKSVLTRGALDFIGKGTFEGITGNRVATELYEDGTRMDHIHLARWADLQLVYPASAETISKFRAGRADDLVGALFLAHEFTKPYWVAPAMNPEMFSHPAVQENLSVLKKWGVKILEPNEGRTACGELGSGRVQEPEELLEQIQTLFSESTPLKGKRVLVTAGGTYEALDPVRGLTNVSTGETGVKVAEGLTRAGAEVTLLLARNAAEPEEALKNLQRFSTFEDLESLLLGALKESLFDVCIHSAAVSDFKVDKVETTSGKRVGGSDEKISSEEGLKVSLSPRHKIVSKIKAASKNAKLQLISFKLSAHEGKPLDQVKGYRDSDFVIHNYASEVLRGSEKHHARFFSHVGEEWALIREVDTKPELVAAIIGVIEK